jgi:hypothetical protein
VIAAPPIELAVSPPRLVVAAGETRALRVTNLGRATASVEVTVAGYATELRGRPVLLAATPALELRPRRLSLASGETATVAVAAPKDAPRGDRPAVVLATRNGVGVRIRVGVLVLVRGSGRVVHRVVATALRRRGRALELWVRNAGNVSERLTRRTLHLRLPCRFAVAPRELLPHTRGVVRIRARRCSGAAFVRAPGARRATRFPLRR